MISLEPNKKFSYKQLLLSVLLTAGIAVGGTYLVMEKYDQTVATSSTGNTSLAEIDRVYQLIKEKYVGEVKDEDLINGALSGMTDAIGDPYSNFLSGLSKDAIDETISGSFQGIGATMTMQNNMPVIIESPIKGTPADKAKLQVNDKVIKVDGKETKGKSLNEVVGTIRGEKNTKVVLTIERDGKTFDVELVRAEIAIESVTSKVDESNKSVALLTVTTFNANTGTDFAKEIAKLKKGGATSFIIDLRDNPGGSLQQVVMMASMFLKDGETIMKIENSKGNQESIVAGSDYDNGNKITEPVSVLVNKNSASASEIFAAAIKENKRGDIVGTTTFGKGTMQEVRELTDDTELKLTVNKWLTPKGNWVNKKGLKPTIEVATPDYYEVLLMDKKNSLQLNSSGENVTSLNTMLKALGYTNEKTTDKFTKITEEAVKKFQEEMKLEVTGIVNETTATEIELKLYQKMQKEDTQYERALNELVK